MVLTLRFGCFFSKSYLFTSWCPSSSGRNNYWPIFPKFDVNISFCEFTNKLVDKTDQININPRFGFGIVSSKIIDFLTWASIFEKGLPIIMVHKFKCIKKKKLLFGWVQNVALKIFHIYFVIRHFYTNYFVCLVLKFA